MNCLSLKKVPIDGRRQSFSALLAVDGKTIGRYINEQCAVKGLDFLYGYSAEYLVCAWEKGLDTQACDRFMSELLMSERDMTIPYLLCDDDTDFSCLVITADIRFSENYVYIDKLSVVENYKNIDDRKYGIACCEAYSDDDWEYWKNLGADEKLWDINSEAWLKWVSENWCNEQYRRLKNGFFAHIQNPKNLTVIAEPKWQFHIGTYRKIIEFYQQGNNSEIPDDLKGTN